jgi:hypothetical protein
MGAVYEDGDITLAGVTMTLEEWEGLDPEAREVLLAIALGDGADDLPAVAARGLDVAAMADMLGLASAR